MVKRRPAVFFDRDGVLNVDKGYTHRPEQLEWITDAPLAVRLLNEANYYVFVVTNQAGIARGFYDAAAVDAFHAHMQQRLMAVGAHVDAFYFCPHHPEGAIKELAVECDCRKPKPGLIRRAAREWSIDFNASFLIGDKSSDVQAAAAFNLRGIKFEAQKSSLVDLVRGQLTAKRGGWRY